MIVYAVQSLIGLGVLVALAWALSEDRRAVPWRFVGIAMAVQLVLALVLVKVPFVAGLLRGLNVLVLALQTASNAGAAYVFGHIGGGDPPYDVTNPANGLVVAFQILPIVIVTSALASLLWHLGVLKAITKGLSWALQRTLGIGGAVGLGGAANLFLGVVEAPLFVRAYMAKMTRAELFAVMVLGLATVSGVVFVLYATTLEPVVPGAIGHILAASIISLPAALLIAKIMVPGVDVTDGSVEGTGVAYENTIDAVTQGTMDGMKLFLNIIAMLIVVVAFVKLGDLMLAWLPEIGGGPITVQRLFGWLFAPLVWLFGVPWGEAGTAGELMGTKAILNEFFAYLNLAVLPEGSLSERSTLIMLYALCGFANLGSIGMMITTISTLVPERRSEVISLGLKAWLAGNLATGMTGAVIGVITF